MLCEQTDPDLDVCWSRTRAYFDQKLVETLNDWAVVELSIDQWQRRHDEHFGQFDFLNLTEQEATKFGQKIVDRVAEQISLDGTGRLVITPGQLQPIVKNLLNLVS